MSRACLKSLIASLFFAFCLPFEAQAQSLAALVADEVRVDTAGQLVATGGVEVYYQGRTLRAQSITYDRTTDQLRITGPIVLVDGESTVLVASQAELSADLSEGILESARLVLNRELQMAASQIQRVAGRYTALDNVVASSCKICNDNPTPLWEIRARRVIHDQQERQIYFDHAQFRVVGLPVAYFPRLRMPDPTLKRTSGFLMPQFRTNSGLGVGVKLPYFKTLGPYRDITITPYLSTKSGRSLELRYRQAFATGEIEVSGALSRDQRLPGETRHYLTATGSFRLPADFRLSFRGEVVSDPAYLLDYGLPLKDRLDSQIEITRVRRNEFIMGRLVGIKSIRDGEVNATLPTIISDLTVHRRFSGGPLGGVAGLRFQTHGSLRSSNEPNDLDGNGTADGRDVLRTSLRLDWRRNLTLPMGLVASVLGEATADAYLIRQDAVYSGSHTRLHGAVATELRWPLVKFGANGVGHFLEPVVQLAWAPQGTETVPNEDSLLVEFDEGNLFSLNRFPGSDAIERGARANLGLSYTRIDPAGWTLSAAIGRVIRKEDLDQFTVASGLDGVKSDWLAATQIQTDGGLMLRHRMLFDADFAVTKSETGFDLQRDRYGIAGSYFWVVADGEEDRPDAVSQLAVDGLYKMNDNWTASASARYDFRTDRANEAGLGLQFRNECVSLDLSLSRRFASSTSVQATTDFGLSVDLVGFGSGAAAGPARSCRR
jgi:LPS-assembly protein